MIARQLRCESALAALLAAFEQGYTGVIVPQINAGTAPEVLMAAIAATMPHIAQLAAMELHESEGSLSMCDTQAEFEFTLALVLDGLEARRAGANGANA